MFPNTKISCYPKIADLSIQKAAGSPEELQNWAEKATALVPLSWGVFKIPQRPIESQLSADEYLIELLKL